MGTRRRTAVVCGKLCTAPEGDYFVTCSFDPNHVLLRSRMTYHIIKCIKQHPDHNKIQCPYDSTEYIDPEEFPNHLVTCESKRSIFSDVYEAAKLRANGSACNIKQTPYIHASAPTLDEEWAVPQSKVEEMRPLVGLGRGVSFRKNKQGSEEMRPLVGLGRAVSLRKNKQGSGRGALFKRYQEQQACNNSESTCPNNNKDELQGTGRGQRIGYGSGVSLLPKKQGTGRGARLLKLYQEQQACNDSESNYTSNKKDELLRTGQGERVIYGSGVSLPPKKQGTGRGAYLLKLYQEQVCNNSESNCPNNKNDELEKNIVIGQFEDAD